MWFLLKLLSLILVCVAIGGAVLFLVARLTRKDPWVYIFGRNAENQWAKVFVLELATIFIVACFNWGPALWLPEKHPTQEQRKSVSAELDYLWYGTNVPTHKEAPLEILDPAKPLPWRHGSWFWWGASMVLLPSCFIFVCWAYSDDVLRYAEKRRKEKREQEETDQPKGENKHEKTKSEEDTHHFWKPDFWDIVSIGEMVARFAKDWKRK